MENRAYLGSFAGALLVLITQVSSAAPALNPDNGHYYEIISYSGTWLSAKANAESQSYTGLDGNLATITSGLENTFVNGLIDASAAATYGAGMWIGGFQPAGSPEPAGNWQWTTGELFAFTNWAPNEPNDISGQVNRLELVPTAAGASSWNDESNTQTNLGYLIEYAVPEPGALGLLGMGTVFWTRRRR